MHGLEAKYGGCIDFVYLDIDNPATADAKRKFGYTVQPDMYLIDGAGKVLWKKRGFVTGEELEQQLKPLAKP